MAEVKFLLYSDPDFMLVKSIRMQVFMSEQNIKGVGQGCTPAEAAAQAGYQDYSTFSRAYKKQFGHGPSADTKGKQQDLQITTQEF